MATPGTKPPARVGSASTATDIPVGYRKKPPLQFVRDTTCMTDPAFSSWWEEWLHDWRGAGATVLRGPVRLMSALTKW